VPEKTAPPEITIANNPKLGSVTVPEPRDDMHLSLVTAVFVFGDLKSSFCFQVENI
jgi:hypothetical protein